MLQHIVMSTDGSAESEKPLSIAAQIARAQDAELTLFRIIEEFNYPIADEEVAISADLYEQLIEDVRVQAMSSLARLEQRLKAQGVRVRTEARRGYAASGVLDYLGEVQPDLVVMATHGRTGLARFTMGSVTDRVVREGIAPVLVTRMSSEPSGVVSRALVMLDGSGVAEEALPLVTTLAGRPIEHLTLYRTVAEPEDRGAAATYLEGVSAHLATPGVSIDIKVDLGDPRPNVERAALETDLIVLCTHGRGGLDRLRHGSVAEHVMRSVNTPALLVRAAAGHD